jgi:hypothetical protein
VVKRNSSPAPSRLRAILGKTSPLTTFAGRFYNARFAGGFPTSKQQ